ncbi:DNA cytosine methyltransferase [Rhodopseudomonas sp. P2A-2r]|uniref:DNA cytosine methyltransferase n=1 Tax=Rhodopseudomonas sp. P2A-2r TaxID=2991972 RepID=UPI002234DB20|nr:DNA cytosine methyltransferase [Rhodopseudomonas sp. P2A-2r]UZE48154.1 DNA cytosine methyltransferase [Rhodopseudomonas sp. P2A-2r]
MNMRVVDLFCGAGGFSQGMQEAGHHVVGAIDYEGAALAVHAANVKAISSRIVLGKYDRVGIGRVSKRRLRQADITDILSIAPDIAELNPDIIIGGPPCQPWSKSGKRGGDDDPRARLTEAFGIMVAATRPQYFVMENVPQISGSKVFRRMKDLVRRAGYGLTEMVVNAGDYGTAQKRARFLCVGALNEADGWFHDYMSEIKLTRPFSVAGILPDFGVELHRKRSKWVATGKQRVAKRTIKDVASDVDGGYRLRAADIRLLERSGDSFKAYWRYPGGRSSGGIRRTDEASPSIIKSSGGGVGKNTGRLKVTRSICACCQSQRSINCRRLRDSPQDGIGKLNLKRTLPPAIARENL